MSEHIHEWHLTSLPNNRLGVTAVAGCVGCGERRGLHVSALEIADRGKRLPVIDVATAPDRSSEPNGG